MNESTMRLYVPVNDMYIQPGNRVKLGRFDGDCWEVAFGWYSWGGNRPVCGWYLTKLPEKDIVKPLQLPDLSDIYLIEA